MANRPLFVATWKFGKPVAEKALEVVRSGHSMTDAIEQGIWVAENDVANSTVGYGGTPNADGKVELDACIMDGPKHSAGAVGGIQDMLHPITIARKVMTETPHVFLVGEGARKFALAQGFEKTEMLSEKAKKRYQEWLKKKKSEAPHQKGGDDIDKDAFPAADVPVMEVDEHHHDTITLIGIDEDNNLYGGCSTSGWGFKVPGRVGDSPIIGSGLYVDNEYGAAGATGTGENVMRYCATFWIVQLMGQGMSPTDACKKVITEIARKDPLSLKKLAINFIAINKKGEHGGAGTSGGFVYATTDTAESKIHKPLIVTK